MEKKYSDFMDEITSDELHNRLIQYGLFSETLPPVFTAEPFLEYCKTREKSFNQKKWHDYITYEYIRNNNIPRNIGIPTPMAHELLCKCLSENWDKIRKYFRDKTSDQEKIISQIHIRKMKETDSLFVMNYTNWKTNSTPEPDIFIGKKYKICADISQCYSSIYTHAIPWALTGNKKSKDTIKKRDLWYNRIDEVTRNSKNGETHGILVGPHTSHIISEIILCAIDYNLYKKYKNYIRSIDDYICYTETREEAEQFLIDLNRELQEFDLSINRKKVTIKELPSRVKEKWVNKVHNQKTLLKCKSNVDYKDVQVYIDYITKLVNENSDNTAILNYAIKILKDCNLTTNAKEYLVKSVMSLALIYPYLVPLLYEHIFELYKTREVKIGEYTNMIYNKYISKNNFEACSYALLYALNSNSKLKNFDLNLIISSKDCILLLMALIYCKKINCSSGVKQLKEYARELIKCDEMDQYWLFIYECLSFSELKDDWKDMKKSDVSFLKESYR